MATFTVREHDLNGSLFVVGSEGEIEEQLELNRIYFPTGVPAAAKPLEQVVYTEVQMMGFLKVNAAFYLASGGTAGNELKVALFRFYAARLGLVSPNLAPNVHNVRYNDAFRLSEDEMVAATNSVEAIVDWPARFNAQIPDNYRVKARKNFSNIVCMLAHGFRVRGHHFLPQMDDMYKKVWTKCLLDEADQPAAWNLIMVHALHGIYPSVLDDFWRICVQNQRCAGALTKRWTSAAAGTAAPFVVFKGVEDIRMVFPGIVDRVPAAHQALVDDVAHYSANRWDGSVNARYYGASRRPVDEGRYAALASVVLGVYNELAKSSPLRASPALLRLAGNAPVVGGALGIAAMRTVADQRMNLLGDTASIVLKPP